MAKKILIVDDEAGILEMVNKTLTKQGYAVTTSPDGKDALDKITQTKFDIIILDIMMPYLDGFEVLQAMKRKPETRNIPVIFLTAKNNDMDIVKGWQAGVNAYLIKPFNPTELVKYVKQNLKKGSQVEGAEKRYEIK